MKESNDHPIASCDDVELLLSKRLVDELTGDEKQLVDKHLKSCSRCLSYERILLSIQDSMQIKAEEKLAPHPAICQQIVQRMKDLGPQETGILRKTYHSFIHLFEYRIPVYQALTGVILIFLLFLGVSHLPFTVGQKPEGLQTITQTDTSAPAQLKVLDNLDIIGKQKIGQNVKEDSTLTQFIVTM
jgi:hypothetical protein